MHHPLAGVRILAAPMTTAGGNIRWLCGLLFPEVPATEALAKSSSEYVIQLMRERLRMECKRSAEAEARAEVAEAELLRRESPETRDAARRLFHVERRAACRAAKRQADRMRKRKAMASEASGIAALPSLSAVQCSTNRCTVVSACISDMSSSDTM